KPDDADPTIIEGTVGSKDDPKIIITNGDIKFDPDAIFYGVVYMLGDGAVIGDESTDDSKRATLYGTLIVDGDISVLNSVNIVYDQYVIRKAGFRAGGFAPLPGSWNDA